MVIKRPPHLAEPPLLDPPPAATWQGRVGSRWAVVTMATGAAGRSLLQVSGPLMRRYARRLAADFRVIRGEAGVYPCARKWEVAAYLRRYERVVWLDADALVAPHCPNLLELVPRGMVGIHDEMPSMPDTTQLRVGHARFCASQGWECPKTLRAWNSGVYVADREHEPVFRPPARPYPWEHCAEQWHEDLTALRLGVPVYPLPESLNYQWWVRRTPLIAPLPGVFIYHYSGMSGVPEERLRQMRLLAARFAEKGPV